MNETESRQHRLGAMLEEAKPPTGGVAIDAIAREVAPVLPLLSELPAEQRVRGDYESFQFRECLTVLTLLGRRLALLDLTPTAAVQVVRLALRVADEGEERSPTRFAERAAAAAIEGFVLGREERVLHLQRQESAATVRPIRVEEKIFALLPVGVHEPEVLTEHVDALGRAMLDADADIAIVDLSQLGGIDRERATAMCSADEVVRMLGGLCFFSGVDREWRAAMTEARIEIESLHLRGDFADALADARQAAGGGRSVRRARWRSLLDRIRPGNESPTSPNG